MNIRIPQSGKAAKLAKEFLQSQGLSASHEQCLELVARLHGYQDWQAMHADPRFADKPVLKADSSTEYTLDLKANGVWVDVQSVSVHIRKNDEGVSVDLFAAGRKNDESMAGTWLTYAEAQAAAEEDAATAWLQYDKRGDNWYWSAKSVPSLWATDQLFPQFEGQREKDWAGAFMGHEDAVDAAVAALGDDTCINWVRSDAPHEAKCAVFQAHGDYLDDLSLPGALEAARNMRDSGAGGTWTVETEDGELIAIYR